MRSIELFRSA